MDGNYERNEAAVENGNLIRLSGTREVAMYLRGGVAWVADFWGERGELFTAREWFALGDRVSMLRCAGRASITPLPARVLERIERLHREVNRGASRAARRASLRSFLTGLFHELSCRTPVAALGSRTQRN